MKVILNENVSKLGYKGDAVNVKDGYFRNFLFPRGLATVATEGKIKLAEKRREKTVLEKERLLSNVKEAMKKLSKLEVEVAAKVTAKGTLYAHLSEADVISAVRGAANIQLEKKFVKFAEPIKTLGKHEVMIDFGEENTVSIKVNVVKA
jgi:large subunit ribosomal protein L9